MKCCTVCNQQKPDLEFDPKRRQCKSCRAEYRKGIKARWYAKNAQHAVQYSREWRQANEARVRQLRREEYAKNAEQAKQAARDYRQTERAKVNAWARARQCAKANRIPKWLTPDDLWVMEQAYELAKLRTELFGFRWEVDHILPLRGKLVSGLHVPTNLQVIPEVVNKQKRNHFVVTT